VAELGEKHLGEIDARLAELRKYRRALMAALSDWHHEDATERECAGEFCDLIERLPCPKIFQKAVDSLLG
jgi:hypothetical protein